MFNLYMHWVNILIQHPGKPPVTLMRREGVMHGDPLLMALCGITPIPLVKEIQAADPQIITPFYADDAAFDRSARRSAELLKLLM